MLYRRPPAAFAVVLVALALLAPIAVRPVGAAPGDLDPSFGIGGLVLTDPPSFPDVFFALVVQPDGKIVGAGLASPDAVLVRYDGAGQLDPGFGTGGIVTTNVPSVGSAAVLSLGRYADGRLITAGNPDIAVRRYLTDGTPDPSFGMGGTVHVPYVDGNRPQARAVALQADEKIVVAGFAPVPSPQFFPTDAVVLMRFDDSGVLDASFDDDGIVTTIVQERASAEVAALLVQPDGALVVAGRSGDRVLLARYLADGALDPLFGDAGVFLGERGSARGLARQPDGKLLTIGRRTTPSFGATPVVTRFLADGALDPSFGEGGSFAFDPAQLDRDIPGLALTGVALQADGRIVVAGSAFDSFTVARLTTKGTLDAGFGDGGIVTTTFGTFRSVETLAVQSDGRVLVAGTVDQALAVARYLGSLCGDATLDADEQCDDDNLVDGDGCDANCTPTACGNGVVTAGEQCDDGNVASGDCCAADCQLEADGSSCDDANLCTSTSSCLAGTCTPGPSTTCDDGDDCRIDTCDPPTGLCRHEPAGTLVCHQQNVALENLQMAFSMSSHRNGGDPDLLRPVLVLGDHVVALSRGDEDAAIEIFDAQTGAYQLALDDPTPNDFQFGPIAALGGDLLVAAEAFRDFYPSEVGRVDLYDGSTFALVRTFFDPTPATPGFATTLLGHAGKVLARDARSHVVELFDAATGAHVHTLAAPGGDPQDAFGALLVPFGADQVLVGDAGAVHLFDLGTGNLVRSFVDPTPGRGAFGTVIAVHGTEVLIGGRREGRVYVFDPTTGAVLGTFEDPTPVDKLFGDPVVVAGNDVMIGRGSGRVHVFDVATRSVRLTILDPLPSTGHCFGQTILPVFGDRLAIADPCFGPGLVTGDDETGQVYLFDQATGALRSIVRNPEHDDNDGFTVVASYQDTLFTYIKGFSDGTIFAHRPCANGTPAFGGKCHDGPCADPDFCPGPCDFMYCGLCTRCDTATVSCMGAPRDACTQSARPERTTLHLRRKSPRIEWKWKAGTALAPGALGDPVAGDRYGICLYEEDGAGSRLLVNGQPYLYQSWRRAADGSFVFRDRARETGIERLGLQTGRAGRAGITARLASPSTPLPTQPVTTRLRVQLQSASSDACWESVHDPVDAGRNSASDFRGPAISSGP